MSEFEKEFYVPMEDLVKLYNHADLGESKEITAIVYPHREYQLEKLNCKRFVLAEELEKLTQEKKEMRDEIEKVRRENKKLREALEFYADEMSYSLDDYYGISGEMRRRVILYKDIEERNDYYSYAGKLARKTLKELEGEK